MVNEAANDQTRSLIPSLHCAGQIRTSIGAGPVPPTQRVVSPFIVGVIGGKRIPTVSSGVMNRRPSLRISRFQNGSVPSARNDPVFEEPVSARAVSAA